MLKKMEDILAQCIEDVKAGRSSIEDCLAKYPSMRKELEPLLRIAISIQEPPDVKPSPAFKVRARVQLMEQIHAKRAVTKWPWFRYTYQLQPILYKRRFNMVAIIIAIVLAVSTLGGGTVYASQGSLPGDALYPVKLGTEQARLVVATSDTAKAERYLTVANSRVKEMTALAEKGRPEKINIAVNGYEGAMAMAIEKMEAASGKGLATANISEVVAVATSQHLSALDKVLGIMDIVPEEAKDAIEHAKGASINGLGNALRLLARENPVRAIQINLAAMEGRLNRANALASENNTDELEIEIDGFLALSGFGQEISEMARGLSDNRTVDELVALATSHHLEVLVLVYDKVPEQAKPAIERAMEISIRGHERAVAALKKKGTLPSGISDNVTQGIPDEVKEKILKPKVPPRP